MHIVLSTSNGMPVQVESSPSAPVCWHFIIEPHSINLFCRSALCSVFILSPLPSPSVRVSEWKSFNDWNSRERESEHYGKNSVICDGRSSKNVKWRLSASSKVKWNEMIVSKRNIKTTTDRPTDRWFHDFFSVFSRLDSLNVMLAAILLSSFNSAQFFFLHQRCFVAATTTSEQSPLMKVHAEQVCRWEHINSIVNACFYCNHRRRPSWPQTAWVSNEREENEKNHANALAAVGWSSETMTTTTEGNSRRLFMKWKCSAISEKCRKIGKLISMEVTASSSSEVLRKRGKLPVWEFIEADSIALWAHTLTDCILMFVLCFNSDTFENLVFSYKANSGLAVLQCFYWKMFLFYFYHRRNVQNGKLRSNGGEGESDVMSSGGEKK